jgi:hypothetical protein
MADRTIRLLAAARARTFLEKNQISCNLFAAGVVRVDN